MAGDLSADGSASIQDVQCSILTVLWSLDGQFAAPPGCVMQPGSPALIADHDCNGVISVADVQLAVQFALGAPLSLLIDGNGNQCADACENDTDEDGDTDWLDCAPLDAAVHAGATEVCNGWDDDCDGSVDDAGSPEVAASCQDGSVCNGLEVCTTPTFASTVAIEEVLQLSAAGPTGAWLELANGTDASFNLRGWRLSTSTSGPFHTIDPGGALFLPPHGRLLLGASTDAALNGGVPVSYALGSFPLSTAPALVLRDANGIIVDSVPLTAPFPKALGQSTALRSPALDSSQPASWALSSAPFGAGGLGTPAGPNFDVAPATCAPGQALVCPAAQPCASSTCDPLLGCMTTPLSPCCGNGAKEGAEGCDGSDFGGATCASLTGGTGALTCTSSCTVNTSACVTSACSPTSPPQYASNFISYSCTDIIFGFTAMSMAANTWFFSEPSPGTLRVTSTPGGIPALQGPMPTCPSGSFLVSGTVFGGCCEKFSLQGSFTSNNTWTATLSLQFCQSPACGCPTGDGFSCSISTCQNRTFAVSGQR